MNPYIPSVKGKFGCKSEAGERGYVAKLAEMMVVEHDVDVDQIRVVVSFDLPSTTTSRQISLVVHITTSNVPHAACLFFL